MPSLLPKLEDHPLLATILMVAATAALASAHGELLVRGKAEMDARSRCYLVAYEPQGKLWVGAQSSVQNSRICVPGAPGTRQVVDAIQTQLQTAMRSSSTPATAVIHNLLLSEET